MTFVDHAPRRRTLLRMQLLLNSTQLVYGPLGGKRPLAAPGEECKVQALIYVRRIKSLGFQRLCLVPIVLT